ncbi:MAG: hypothetical protein SGPRY_009738, partial [Prymnesium sp.]
STPAPWASLSHATLICIRCAGVHRSFGVNTSFVRSCALDEWSHAQRALLAKLGNAAFREFLEEHGVSREVWLATPLETRYFTPVADLYRRRVHQLASGEDVELPTEMRPRVRPPVPTPSKKTTATWTDDADAPRCQLCRQEFYLFCRRHHCRKCGRCICSECSPLLSFRPLPQLGYSDPVRHCKLCMPPPAKPMVGMGTSSRMMQE